MDTRVVTSRMPEAFMEAMNAGVHLDRRVPDPDYE